MTRDGMPRAYLRMSPDLDQHPDPLAMVKAMCSAARQPDRGRFRHPEVLARIVGKRQYRAMVERGDVVKADPGPGVYLDGWDEWQEGDHTVAERMRRMRERRRRRSNGKVTPPPSHDRNDVTTDAGTTTEEVLQGDGDGVSPPNPPPSGGHGSRANGTSPRQIAARARAAEKAESDRRKAEAQALKMRYYRGEITEDEYAHLSAEMVPA